MKKTYPIRFLIIVFFVFLSLINLQAAELKKVSLQLMWLDQFEFAGFYIAKEKGYYKDVGLDVELKKFTASTNVVDTVLSGKADFGTSSTSLLIASSLGEDILLLGSVFQSSPLILLALKDSNIKNLEDIKGKKAMITKEQTSFATLQTMLLRKHININDLNLIEHSFNVEDLINKNTDLMLAYSTNEPFLLKERGYESTIFNPKDYGFDFYEELIFTTNAFNNKNPKMVNDFYKASIKGWKYAFEHIEEVAQLIFEKYNPQQKSLKSLIYEGTKMKELALVSGTPLGTITKEKLELIANSYKIMGLIDYDLNIDKLIHQPKTPPKFTFTKEEQNYLFNKKKIKMCVDPNWMPYEKIEEGKHIGMSADFMHLIEKIIGIPIVLIPTQEWSQSITYAQSRRCDIFSLAKETPLRKEYMNFTQPYFNFPVVLATTSDKIYMSDVKNILDKPLGIVKNFALIELLKIKYPHINIVEVNSPLEGLKKVKNLELYGYVDSLVTIGYELQRNFSNDIKVSGQFDSNFSLSIASRNDEPLLHSILQKATTSISEKTKQKIINDWISINVQEPINYVLLWTLLGILVIVILAIIYKQVVLNRVNTLLEKKVSDKTLELKALNNSLERTIKIRTDELQDSIEEFQHLFQTTMEAIFILQYDYCLDANNEALKLFNFKDTENVIGTYLFDLIQKDSHTCVKENDALTDEKPFEIKAIKQDGSIFPAMIKIHTYKTKNKTVKVIAIIDLTKLKEQELHLIKQSKMASLAELIGNIAHQWRQPLAVISTAASGIQIQKELDILTDKELSETCDSIVSTSKYLSETINDFKRLINSNKHEDNFNINEPIKKSISLLQGLLDAHSVQVITSFDEDKVIYGYENELTQAIINILKNATTVLEERNDAENRFIFISTSCQNNSLEIHIKDNAGGISSDIIDKIFEPYFTTKHQSQGKGLGLYMTHQIIVDNMQGQIEANNVSYIHNNFNLKGVEFKITFGL